MYLPVALRELEIRVCLVRLRLRIVHAAPRDDKADDEQQSADQEGDARQVHGRGVHPLSSLVRRSTLEDVFLHLTGRSLVD